MVISLARQQTWPVAHPAVSMHGGAGWRWQLSVTQVPPLQHGLGSSRQSPRALHKAAFVIATSALYLAMSPTLIVAAGQLRNPGSHALPSATATQSESVLQDWS
jgi:hypothetical protein